MAVLLQRNKFVDEYNWRGTLEMPALEAEVYGDDTCDIPESIDFELCLNDWWHWFTAEDDI